jgi:prenylated cyclic peptide (anacyclamide/piricyclamide family)
MTQKNLKLQQAAPVQREINTTSFEGGTGLSLLEYYRPYYRPYNPFAGDDAE